MDVLIDSGLVNGGWLSQGVSGLFNGLSGLTSEDRIPSPVDIVEERASYRFSVDLPGLKSDSLEVKVEDGTLVISAERPVPAWGEGARVHRAERHYGRVRRAFRLPSDVGDDAIKAAYKDGVLELTVTKRPEATAAKIEIAYN
jgi:HSP20 family protein